MLLARRRAAVLQGSGVAPNENFLFLSRLRRSTVNKYKIGARRAFAKKHRKSLRYGPASVHCALDRTLEQFVETSFRSGEGIAEARNCVWGYVFCERLPRRSPGFLHRTKQALAGWASRCPGKEGRPSPWIATLAICRWLAKYRGVKGVHAARALVVQQRGYMRPSEVLELTSANIHCVPRSRRGLRMSGVAVTVCPRPELPRRTKSNTFEDTIAYDKACDAQHSWVCDLLRDLKA